MIRIRFFKNKKAFSAVIASLILMLLAVAAGAVVYAYVMGWIGGVQTTPTGSGVITIESWTSDTLYIRNHGTAVLTVDAVYLNNALVPEANMPITLTLDASTVTTFGAFDTTTFAAGNIVKVVCTDATTVSQTLT